MDHDDDDEFHYHGEDSDSMDSTSEEIEGLEKLTINSVGIDIGSSTTHLIFSRLILRRRGFGFFQQLHSGRASGHLPVSDYAYTLPIRRTDRRR